MDGLNLVKGITFTLVVVTAGALKRREEASKPTLEGVGKEGLTQIKEQERVLQAEAEK